MLFADYNSTTPLDPAVKKAMAEAMEVWGNPSSIHAAGRSAKKLLEESRRLVANRLGVGPDEVVFTSGGSEANTLAIWGSYLACEDPAGFRLLTSGVEHSSIRDAVKSLEGPEHG